MPGISPSNCRAMVFDAYGTLFNVVSIRKALNEQFGPPAEKIEAIWRQKQLEYTWLRTLMEEYKDFYALTEDALVYALQATGTSARAEQIRTVMSAYYQLSLFPDVQEALPVLAQRYPLAILSNANPSLLERACAFCGIDDSFDHLISADRIQTYKPAPAVYRMAEEQLGFRADQIQFISANTWDIAGAASAGFSTTWLNRNGGVPEVLGHPPGQIVQSLLQLLT